MLKKNYLIIIVVIVLLAAGVAADVFFWKHIAAENQHQQQTWQGKVDTLSAQLDQQRTALSVLQIKLNQVLRSEQQNSTAQALNEIEYLLEIANLYLQINHDINSSTKSLEMAQQRLQSLNDPSLLSLQQAIASDLNTLNDTPKLDTSAVLIKLQTLSESIDRLTFTPQPQPTQPVTKVTETKSASEKQKYQQYLQKIWNKFKNLFVIHHNKESVTKITPYEQRGWIRENMAFTLAEAQWAVLQQKADLYQNSLSQVQKWLIDNYSDNEERKQILSRISELTAVNIAFIPPDITHSLQAVQKAIKDLPPPNLPANNPAPNRQLTNPTAPNAPTAPPAPEKPPEAPSTGVEI